MKFYGIESEGKFRLPIVATLPTYDYTKHKGTLYYQTSDDVVYQGIGDASGSWVRTGIASVTVLPPGDEEEGDPNEEGLLLYVQETGLLYYRTADRWIVINGQIANNLTLYITTTGNDLTGDGTEANPWYSINAAMNWLNDKYIAHGSIVTILLGDGTYTYTETQVVDHLDGDRIKITGENIYAKTISNVTAATPVTIATTGSTVTATITIDNSSDIEVGDYVMIRNMHQSADIGDTYQHTGADFRNQSTIISLVERGYVHHLNGIFRVTVINSSTSITVSTEYRANGLKNDAFLYGTDGATTTAMTGAHTGELTVLKTILNFNNNTSGIIVRGNNSLGDAGYYGIDKVALIGSSGDTLSNRVWEKGVGIAAMDLSHIEIGPYVGINNFWIGFGTTHSSSMYCDSTVATGCYHAGYYSSFGSSMFADNAYVSGCRSSVYAAWGGSISANAIGAACISYNCQTWGTSSIFAECFSADNCTGGLCSTHNGHTVANGCRISNCITGIQCTRGGSVVASVLYSEDCKIHNCDTVLYATQGATITCDSTITGTSGYYFKAYYGGTMYLNGIDYSAATATTAVSIPAVNTLSADGSYIKA